MSIPNVNWGGVSKAFGSKAFENIAGVAGSLLGGKAAADRQDENNAARRGETEASLFARLLSDEMENRRLRAQGAADAAPLGANENFAARQAMLRQILGGATDFNATPGDPAIAAAMGTQTGGLRVPEGGFDVSHLSPEATAAAIKRRQGLITNIDASAPTADFGAMGFSGDVASANTTGARDYAATRTAANTKTDDANRARIMQALDRDLSGNAQDKKPGSPWWKKAIKIASIAAPIVAAPFTGGASLLAIGALSGAAGGAMDGGWKGALLGGGAGALSGGLAGGAASGAARAGAGQIAKNVAVSAAPDLMQAALNRNRGKVRF